MVMPLQILEFRARSRHICPDTAMIPYGSPHHNIAPRFTTVAEES